MTLKKTTALGDITINDSVIARAIINSAAKAGERLFLATEKGKIIGTYQRAVAVTCRDILNLKKIKIYTRLSFTLS